MGDWRHQSVAQRRRIGAPHSIYESQGHDSGAPLARDAMSEAVAGMASTGSPRQPMDRSEIASLVNASADYTSGAKLHPRYSQPAMDPALFPTARPKPVLQQKAGARYGLKVQYTLPVAPEAGPTQANGRMVRGRGVAGSFYGG